jgi:lipopolysaccharide assembly protein A
MRYFHATLGFVLFLVALGFALKNAAPVTLHYYLGFAWQAPLSLTLLIAFVTGVVAGLVTCCSLLISQRRRLAALQRELDTLQSGHE